jgi:hypothetical protein
MPDPDEGCECPGLCHVHHMWKGGESLRLRLFEPESFVKMEDGVMSGIDEETPVPSGTWAHNDPIGRLVAPVDPVPPEPSPFEPNVYTFQISRQMAEDHGLLERSDEDARKAYDDHYAFIARCREAWIVWQAVVMLIGKIEDPLARKVLDLHSMTERRRCDGCAYAGYDGDAPEWPCPTVRLVTEHAYGGFDWPDMDYDTAMQCGAPEKKDLALEQVSPEG